MVKKIWFLILVILIVGGCSKKSPLDFLQVKEQYFQNYKTLSEEEIKQFYEGYAYFLEYCYTNQYDPSQKKSTEHFKEELLKDYEKYKEIFFFHADAYKDEPFFEKYIAPYHNTIMNVFENLQMGEDRHP